MASPATTGNGEIIPKNQSVEKAVAPAAKMANLIQAMTPELGRALPKHITGERMARIVLTAIRLNPQLAETTPASFLGCVLSCAVIGLEPNTPLGLAFLIPRRNNKQNRLDCTLQIGYPGMIELAGRAGTNVSAQVARLGDDFRYQLGTDPKIWHIPSEAGDREDKPITHSYSVAVTPDGRANFTVLSLPQIEKRRARSATPNEGPWITDFEAMCLKTAVRAHFKWMPKSIEKSSILAHGVAVEESIENGTPLLAAMDPAVTEALEKHGVDTSEIAT
jgi:recombination protein RecT